MRPDPAAAMTSPAQRGVQTIIKMKDATVDPRRPEVLVQLSKAANSTITYVRPMSGNAHVIVVLPTPPISYDDALRGIRESGLVEYVELDAIMKALPQR